MRIAIISDIHSNLIALESVVHEIEQLWVDKIVCLGDVVGYGPAPNECVDLIKQKVDVCLMGNHDWAVLGKENLAYFNTFAREAVLWSQTHISEEMKRLKRNRRLMVAVIVAHIVLGAVLSLWVTDWVDTERRKDLLRQTQLLAEAIQPDRLASLTGSEFDIEKPEYHRFKQQFASVQLTNDKCRRVYLIGCTSEGKLFDIVDSHAVGSQNARQPGAIYADAPPEFARIMKT